MHDYCLWRTLCECFKFGRIIQIKYLHLNTPDRFSTKSRELASQFLKKRWKYPVAGGCDASADDYYTVDKLCGYGHCASGRLAKFGKGLACRLDVARSLAVGNFANLLRLETVFMVARSFRIYPLDSADGHAFLHDDSLLGLMGEAESFDTRIVAAVELTVYDGTESETGSESIPQQIMITLIATGFFKTAIEFRERPTKGLTIGKEVAIIIDKYRYTEFMFQERPKSHSITERWEIREITANYAFGIIGRSRKCKTDRHRFFVKRINNLPKTFYHCCEALIQIMCI